MQQGYNINILKKGSDIMTKIPVTSISVPICNNLRENETVLALIEAERIVKDSSIKGYNDVDELFADLDA